MYDVSKDPAAPWKKTAYALRNALRSIKLKHAPGCDASNCTVCAEGQRADSLYEAMAAMERDNTPDWES
jgi:hypothetical protein